jgi:DNA primase
MASNARPLWSALPEGALKRQLLGEMAEMVQLSTQELGGLWMPAAAARAPAPAARERDEGYSRPREARYASRASAPRPQSRGRVLPTSRPDIAARLLLSNMAEWEGLSHELHGLLCDLPGAHGQLFAWLDSQLHEHGVQPWAALREGMRGTSFEALAERVMTGPDGGPIGDTEGEQATDAARELRNVLDFMLDDLLKAQQSEAIAAVGSDPRALERYKALEARRLELRARLQPGAGLA